MPTDPTTTAALPRAKSVGELREGLVQMMDIGAWGDQTIHESKEVLLRTPGATTYSTRPAGPSCRAASSSSWKGSNVTHDADPATTTAAAGRPSPAERQRQDARFHELRAQGVTYAVIAAEFGLTKQAIAKRYQQKPHRRPGRCVSRVNHPPHVARWQNRVETMCDGQPEEKR